MSRIGLILVLLAAAVGALVGAGAALWRWFPDLSRDDRYLVEYTPLPHHVPKHRGGLVLRFAMVHDVIHERYPKHGPAHIQERVRLTREALAKLDPDDPAAFPLVDDLAVGLDRLGRSGEAVPLLRDKLARQEKRGLIGRDLYTTYANLGTVLVHSSAKGLLAGDAAARERFREGVRLVRRSVEVNPEAHFGREEWQAAIAEFVLDAADHPAKRTATDCIGNDLSQEADRILSFSGRFEFGYGRSYTRNYDREAPYRVPAYFRPDVYPDDPAAWDELHPVREFVTKVGPDDRKVPFDEPVLGIIGMWRQGGGANPHFALALGETMVRVGQRHIAWAGYERAYRLAHRFWPSAEQQDFLRTQCRKRQREIEDSFAAEAGRSEGVTADQLRAAFDAELARGEGYQKAYRDYEAAKIAAGVPIDDPNFFDEFHAGREPIASPTGPEEWYAGVSRGKQATHRGWMMFAWGVLTAGLAAFPVAVVVRVIGRRPAAPEPADADGV